MIRKPMIGGGCPTWLRLVMGWHPDPAVRKEQRLRMLAAIQVVESRRGNAG